MSNCLVVLVKNKLQEEVCHWRVVSENSNITARGSSLFSELAGIKHDKFVLVVPGQSVTSLQARLNAKNMKQLRSVAPFAIEDDIAGDIEDQHVALNFKQFSEGEYPICVTSKAQIECWIEQVKQLGLKADKIVPDYFCLPALEGKSHYVSLGSTSVFRIKNWGTSFDTGIDSNIISGVIKSAAARWKLVEEPETLGFSDYAEGVDDPYDAMAQQAVKEEFSLLQGEYASNSNKNTSDLKHWKMPTGLAAAALIAIAAYNFVEGFTFRSEAQALNSTIKTEIRRVFPEVKRVVNPRAQLKALVSNGGETSHFLRLSSLLSAGVNEVDGISLDTLRYDERRKEMQASIEYENYEQLNNLKTVIESMGGVFRDGGSRQVGNRRAGEITVTM